MLYRKPRKSWTIGKLRFWHRHYKIFSVYSPLMQIQAHNCVNQLPRNLTASVTSRSCKSYRLWFQTYTTPHKSTRRALGKERDLTVYFFILCVWNYDYLIKSLAIFYISTPQKSRYNSTGNFVISYISFRAINFPRILPYSLPFLYVTGCYAEANDDRHFPWITRTNCQS